MKSQSRSEPACRPTRIGSLRPGIRLAILCAIVLAISLQACSGVFGLGAKQMPVPDSMLLSAGDFPGSGLRETQRLGQRDTRDGGQTAQVVLENDHIKIYQSVVVFSTEEAAKSSYASILDGEAASLAPAAAAPSLGQESLAMVQGAGAESQTIVVFRQGQTLVRMTLVGAGIDEFGQYLKEAEALVKNGG